MKLKQAVANQNEDQLVECLDFRNKFDLSDYEWIERALIGTWHGHHEDLVNKIYLDNLIDDRFVDPIVDIALKADIYRPYDFDLESCLRKCIHALKTINSAKALQAIEDLKKLNNSNIGFALEIYE